MRGDADISTHYNRTLYRNVPSWRNGSKDELLEKLEAWLALNTFKSLAYVVHGRLSNGGFLQVCVPDSK